MRFGSVCSGIEAASVAWHPLGWEAAWLSEIEPFPSAVLAHHYPNVPNLGDMTALPDRILSGEIEAPDLFCGGTPCQAFSVAGLRNSLDDARGNLSLTFVGIADAIDYVRSARGESASIVFWENVPGVLSTKDNAFGCFLAGLSGEDNPLEPPRGKWANAGYVLGPKRAVAWRLLDAQYFGVAQRRKRVFVVASARDDFDPAAVLFEWGGVRRDSAPSREAGKIAPTIPSRSTAGGGLGTDFDLDGGVIRAWPAEVSSTLDTSFGPKQGLDDLHLNAGCPLFVPAQPISIHPHCIGRKPESGPQGKEYLLDGSAYCMDSRGQPQAVALPIAFHPTQDPIISTDGTTHGLGCGSSGGQASVAVAQPVFVAPAEVGPCMGSSGPPYSRTGNERVEADAIACTTTPPMAVRRLTPVECERLQGFPNNYTNIPWRKKDESPDGPRYKALGNSWAVPSVRWIGKRIQEALNAPT